MKIPAGNKWPLLAGFPTFVIAVASFFDAVIHRAFLEAVRSQGFEAIVGAGENQMAVISCLGFAGLGLGIIFRSLRPGTRSVIRSVFLGLTVTAIFVCGIVLTSLVGGSLSHFGGTSAVTTGLFLLTSITFGLGWPLKSSRLRLNNLVCSLSVVILLVSTVLLVAYLYRVPLLISGPWAPPAPLSVLSFVLLSTALFLHVAPESTLFGFLFRATLFSHLIRSLFPTIVFLILLGGWFDAVGIFGTLNRAVAQTAESLVLALTTCAIVVIQSRLISQAFVRTTKKLQESERRFQTVVEQMGDGFELIDAQGSLLEVNDACCRILGYHAQELLGLRISDIDLTMTRERFDELFGGLVGRAPLTFESKKTRKDGTVLTVEVTASVVSMNGQNRLIALVRDTTARKQSEAALKESEYFFRESQRIGNIGSYKLDLISGTWESSDTLEHILGIDRKLTHTIDAWVNLLHPEDREEMGHYLREEVIDHRRPFNREYRIIRQSDREIRWIHGLGEIQYDERDNPTSLIGTLQDITDKKRSEELLQRSQKLDSLGILAGGIAHDFNNLLAGIFGYIDLAHHKSHDEQISGYLAKAHNTLERARGLTGQLLTFAKGGTPVMGNVALAPLLQETAQFALSGSNVAVRFEVSDELWPCRLDRNQIGQVIDNLVINAQQAMPGGGILVISAANVTLDASEGGVPTAGPYVRLSFKDEGIGIPAHLHQQIFDPFFTTKSRGHGLGLATCYSIVKRHGGSIDVASEPGRGSTFYVCLPAADLAQESLQAADEPHHGAGRFLVMDDEPVILETLGGLLTDFGYTVESQPDGHRVLAFVNDEAAHHRSFVGMVLDLTVPGGMGGKEVAAELRRRYSDLPLFVASGYADDPVMANPNEFGFTASLRKPFDRVEIARLLNLYMPKLE